jgi:hypothetical protein
MITAALFARLEAKAGREEDVAAFLETRLALANQEATTSLWFAERYGPSTVGAVDAFADQRGRPAHLSGAIARALMAKAPELFATPHTIEAADVLDATQAHEGLLIEARPNARRDA